MNLLMKGAALAPPFSLYDKILQRRLFAPPAGHPCPASSDKTARPFYDRTARPRHFRMRGRPRQKRKHKQMLYPFHFSSLIRKARQPIMYQPSGIGFTARVPYVGFLVLGAITFQDSLCRVPCAGFNPIPGFLMWIPCAGCSLNPGFLM